MDEIEIIGINNFIGFHLAKYFLEQGTEVIGYKLPLENDDFQLKKYELGRNANLTIKELNEATLKKNVIIDLYGLDEKRTYYEQFKEQLTDAQYLIIMNEANELMDLPNILKLPTVFGPWDYLEDEELIKENDSFIGITDICTFLEKNFTKNEIVNIDELQSSSFQHDFMDRQEWIERYKKSK